MTPPTFPASSARATMDDVARLSGVSLKSVSRVINGEPHVSATLRAKVEAAIAELNYVPDAAARSLAGSRTFIIGLLLDNPSPHYTMKIQKGVYDVVRSQQYHLRIDNIDSTVPNAQFSAQLEALIRNNRCDGFVLTPPLSDNLLLLDFLEARMIRYVRIAPALDNARGPGIAIDDAAAAAAMARHLWDLGHRRFAVMRGPASHRAAARRRDGFIAELERLGNTAPVIDADGGFSFEGGIAAGEAVIAQSPGPTAVFACNDDSAAGVMAACSKAGLKVPDDISVCGFDDSWIARSVWPYLTTVYQPIEEMGQAAAALLLRRDEQEGKISELGFKLVIRDSTAPPPLSQA